MLDDHVRPEIQLESKGTIGPRLGKGQSPDYFDALIQALATDGAADFSWQGSGIAVL